jgi:hypothetical protein
LLHGACSGVLAENDAMLAPDQTGIEALVVGRVLEQSVDVDSGLVGESAFADNTFLPAQGASRSDGDSTRNVRETGQIDARLDAMADVQTEHDFLERGIARALAETVHRRVEVRRAGAGGGQRVGRGHSQIVVGMHLDFQIATGAQMTDALEGRKGVEHAQRIGKTDALGTRRLRRFGDRRQQFRVAARSVLGTDADAKSQIACQTHMLADLRQQPPPIALQFRVQMLIRSGYRNVDQLWTQDRPRA